MFFRLSAAVFCLALLVSLGCSSPDDDADEPDAGVEDVDDDDADVDDVECVAQNECADDEYCHDGECHDARSCRNTSDWEDCADAFAEIDEDLARRAWCDGDYCRVSCILDEDCADGDVCSDNGHCVPFTGEITGEHPGGDEAAPLQAGVSENLLKFPIGLSLGGYGSRAATNDGRYVESLEESHGKMHGLTARGLAVDDGQRQLVFVRAPIIFPTGAVHEAVARKLQEHTGDDWRSSLIISGSHTHSGPARFWQLPGPDDTAIPLGMFGIDEFHDQPFQWLVESLAEAAVDAVDDLQPAEMGWEIVEEFDTDDVISSDRRSQTPPFDDNRVLLLRVDDPDGTPRALLTSFGTHGTVHSGPYANDDVIIGAETMLEHRLAELYDDHVPVMYFNQNGGTMSPRGDRDGHSHTQRYENLGAHLADRTIDAIESMETTDDWTLNAHTHRFPILHEYLGYEGDEFADDIYGGIQCASDPGDAFDEHIAPDGYGCGLLGFHQILSHRPMSLISKSQTTAIQLNDLTVVTMPGELSMSLGWQIQRELRDELGIDPLDSFTWGYAQDHLLYLLPKNLRGELPPFPGISTPQAPDDYPNYAFSWLQGGYEADMSPWGHRFGDFLVDRAVEAVGLMLDEIDDDQLEHPAALPEEFPPRGSDEFPVETTDPDLVGTITEAPNDQVQRRDPVEVAWLGGDPGAEMPQAPRVTLQRMGDDDEFETVIWDNQRSYDNRQFTMLTRLREHDDGPEWVVYWEELHDFPTGTYRFHIEGHHLEDDGGEPVGYQTTTDPFELVGTDQLIIDDMELTEPDELTFRVAYPPAEELSISGSGTPSGSYRMHDRHTPTGAPIAVDADDVDELNVEVAHPGQPIDVADVSTTTDGESVDGYDGVPTTRVTVELDGSVSDELDVSVDVSDIHTNSGAASETVEYN